MLDKIVIICIKCITSKHDKNTGRSPHRGPYRAYLTFWCSSTESKHEHSFLIKSGITITKMLSIFFS